MPPVPAPVAPRDGTLQTVRSVGAAIAAEVVEGLVYVRAHLDGSKPAWFVVDTGSSVTVVDTSTAVAWDLNGRQSGRAAGPGTGGSERLSLATGVSLRVGSLALAPQTVAILPTTYVAEQDGHATGGFLNPFKRHCVSIEYLRSEVRVGDPARCMRSHAVPLALRIRNKVPYVQARILSPNGREVSGTFLVDSGLTSSVVLFKPFVDAHPELLSGVDTIRGPDVSAVGGRIAFREARLPALEIGSFVLKNPVVMLPQSARGAYADRSAAGSLGAGLLERFTVTFDYAHRRLFLAPNRRFSSPFEADSSGVRVVTQPPALHVFEVEQVISGQPGATAGLRVGDRVTSVNGRATGTLTLEQLRAMLRRPNRSYVLGVLRDGRSKTLTIHTRRLL